MRVFGLIALICVFIIAVLFIRECNRGFGYQAGSGLGSLVDINTTEKENHYRQKYLDSFFFVYPQYKAPPSMEKDDFLHLTAFYFDNSPREVYYVQWEGTGFLTVRFAYSYEFQRDIIENERQGAYINDQEKQRIEKRFTTEVLRRIDSIIATSSDRDSVETGN